MQVATKRCSIFQWVGLALVLTAAGVAAPEPGGEAVLVLHGLARSSHSMQRMETALAEAGFDVYPVAYPSREKTVEALSREDLAAAVEACQSNRPARIHFVSHSLGGIIIRHYLGEHRLTNLGRVAMLGPPNQGSEVVDTLGHLTLFEWINGPAGLQLGTASNGFLRMLQVPEADVGVIAGTRSINLILSTFIPGPDDGKVGVEHAKLDGMADFKAVPTAHPFLMNDPDVIAMTIRFLRTGQFEERR
ncbi:MAG: alpha/beta fold hydrolase [Lentisphaerae bacterium]|nr:alpha/beta fold hydrolase [Lentisphaerota bacterium]